MSTVTRRITLSAGETETFRAIPAPWTLSIAPAAGATVTVELSNGDTWHPLGEPLTAAELIAFPAPVNAIRVSAADAGATVEVAS